MRISQSQVKFIRKGFTQKLEDWQEKLNKEGKIGWVVIQVFQTPDGKLAALLRRDT